MKKLVTVCLVFAVLGFSNLVFADSFRKVMTDAEGGFKIIYLPSVGKEQTVSANLDLYVAWLAKGNTPEIIPYKAPPPASPLTFAQKVAKVQRMIAIKQDQSYEAGFIFEGKQYPSNLQYREFMATGVRLAEQAIKNNVEISINVIASDGSISSLSASQLLDLQATYDTVCLVIYNLFIQEMATLKQATESMLDYYIQNGAFE